MKNIKKVLSVVLAVVMVLSALTLVAFAHTRNDGVEVASSTNIKYEITQVASVTSLSGDVINATNNDIYAVTAYAKCPANVGLLSVTIPFQYDKTVFEPMMLVDEGELYTGDDEFSGYDMPMMDFIRTPERFNDTGTYDKNGNPTTAKLKITCFGNANTTAGQGSITAYAKFVGPLQSDTTMYNNWITGLDGTRVGVVFGFVDLISAGADKDAYLNAVSGKLVNDEYLEMITVYFKRISGKSEADAYGKEFGCANPEVNYGTDAVAIEATMGTGNGAGANMTGTQSATGSVVNFINGAVDAPVKPLATLTAHNAKAQQIAFQNAETVDYRFVAQFSRTAFPIAYDESSYKINSTDIEEVGFLVARSSNNYDLSTYTSKTAADILAIENSKEATAINRVPTNKISCGTAGDASFAFSARITDISINTATGAPKTDEYDAVPYVISGGVAYFGAQILHSDIQGRYNTYKTAAGY